MESFERERDERNKECDSMIAWKDSVEQ